MFLQSETSGSFVTLPVVLIVMLHNARVKQNSCTGIKNFARHGHAKGDFILKKTLLTGTVAKMLGMSSEAIRFYEKRGIVVNLEANSDNGYRQYIRHTITHLIKARYLKSMEFSLLEVNEQNSQGIFQVNDHIYMQGSSIDAWQETLEKRKNQLNLEIEQKQKILSTMEKYQKQIKSIQTLHDNYLLEYNPEMLYFNFSNENDEMLDTKEFLDQVKKCIDLFPMSRYAFMCSQDTLTLDNRNIRRGFFIPSEEKEKSELCLKDAVTIRSTLCLHTIVSLDVNVGASTDMLRGAINYIDKHNYTIQGDAFGMWFANARKENCYVKYFEVWIPISQN